MPNAPWTSTVFTLYPELFPGNLGASILGKALDDKVWNLDVVNIRDSATDKHQTVDDTAFGGGPGMVMRADVLDQALSSAFEKSGRPDKVVYLSPRGTPFTQSKAKELSECAHVAFICGRFEGVDHRVLDHWDVEEISLGDFVLAGGEVAAQAVIESTVRLLPGVLGAEESLEEESFSNGLLEYPQYTRPRAWNNREVPEVLTSGHHGKISAWRQAQSEELTKQRRPDLWEKQIGATTVN